METLSGMLKSRMNMEPECDAEARSIENDLNTIKSIFKDWLRTVSLGGLTEHTLLVIESTRQLLITLVDGP